MLRILRATTVACIVLGAVLGALWLLGGTATARVSAPAGALPGVGVQPQVTPTGPYSSYMPIIARLFEARLEPDDTMYVAGEQWALEKVKAPEAWFLSTGHAVTVAVIDTGVALTHTDLVANLWVNGGEIPDNSVDDDGNGYVDDVNGWDFDEGDAVPNDENGHGTHVAGIVGATTNNGEGVAAMGWGVTVMPIRALDAGGNGGTYEVSEAIRYAADNGAQVINLSLGAYAGAPELASAVSYAQDAGALVVAAGGNHNRTDPLQFYPAAYPGVIGVAATDDTDQKASFSNYGSWIDIAAPGVVINSTLMAWPDYGTKSGTSMSTPMVSGLAALIWTWRPALSATQVWEAIRDGAVDLGSAGWDPYFGWGRMDAARAMSEAASGGASVQATGNLTEVHASGEVPGAAYRPGEVIVALHGTTALQELGAAGVLAANPRAGVYLVRVPVGSELASARAMRERGDVVYAHPNYVLEIARP